MESPANHLKTMRAWYAKRRGNPGQVLALRNDYPSPPKPTGADLLVRVSYAALNPADIALTYVLPTWLPWLRDRIPCNDFSGKIELAGPSTPKEFTPGVEVCGCLTVASTLVGRGSLAEFLLVPSHAVSLAPKRLGLPEAAGLSMTGQTAAMMLNHAKIKPGDRIFVNGGSGGVGSILVQVSKGMGAHVTATCSAANIEMVKRLGADEVSKSLQTRNPLTSGKVIDYRANAPLDVYLKSSKMDQPFNQILDTIRNVELYRSAAHYLKPDGLYINIGADGTQLQQILGHLRGYCLPTWLGGTPRRYMTLGLAPSGELQREVVKWADNGLLKEIPMDSELPMEDALHVCRFPIRMRVYSLTSSRVSP